SMAAFTVAESLADCLPQIATRAAVRAPALDALDGAIVTLEKFADAERGQLLLREPGEFSRGAIGAHDAELIVKETENVRRVIVNGGQFGFATADGVTGLVAIEQRGEKIRQARGRSEER